jgi:hypothetical protein
MIKYGTGNVKTVIGFDFIGLNSLVVKNQSFGVVIQQKQFPENFFSFSSVSFLIFLNWP